MHGITISQVTSQNSENENVETRDLKPFYFTLKRFETHTETRTVESRDQRGSILFQPIVSYNASKGELARGFSSTTTSTCPMRL
jgi:hypothetical protein